MRESCFLMKCQTWKVIPFSCADPPFRSFRPNAPCVHLKHTRAPTEKIFTFPVVDESHMAVVYCLSSSGALSFRSNVSIATRTRDTWLGLSEKAIKRQIVYNTKSTQTAPNIKIPWTKFPDAVNMPANAHKGAMRAPLNRLNCTCG